MLSIRLKRMGSRNDPSFRIIVQDHRRSPKKTRGISEYVGNYDARKGKPTIDAARVQYWMSQGAKPTETVHNLLVDAKILAGKKVNAHNRKTKPEKKAELKKEETPKPAAPAPESAAPAADAAASAEPASETPAAEE